MDTSDGGYPTVLTASMGIKVTKTAYITGRYNWYYCVTPDHQQYSLGAVDTKSRGYYQSASGLLETPSNVDSTQNCAKIGTTPANNAATGASSAGLQGTSPSVWQAWVN